MWFSGKLPRREVAKRRVWAWVRWASNALMVVTVMGLGSASFVACGDDDSGGGDAGENTNSLVDGGVQDGEVDGGDDELWYEPDPQGRVTQGSLLGSDPTMVVVTSAALAPAWERYAGLRSVQGVHTEVVALEDALAGQSGVDDAEKLQAYLRDRVTQGGLRFVLLGGDAEVVPFRRVENEVTMATQETYTSNGPSMLYYANLDATWDGDGDGIFGEMGDDMTLEDSRQSQLAPGRVPASHPEEVEAYTVKVEVYAEALSGRTVHPLLVSDIAATVPIVGDIDAAEAIEVTFEEFFPQNYKQNVRKLYATEGAASTYGGEVITDPLFDEALDEGYSLVFHQGHGSHGWFTNKIPTSFVEALDNEQPSVFLSCACLAGNYADVATSMLCEDWSPQSVDDDSAGEIYIVGEYGGVAYLGNTGTGLGPVGGAQFMHAMMEGVFMEGIRALGEAVNYARGRAREIEFQVSVMPDMMDDDSEWWTQHVVTLLGDPSLELQVGVPELLTLELPEDYGPGYQEMVLVVTDVGGDPVSGVTVGLWKTGDFFLTAETNATGRAEFSFIPYGPGELQVGAYGDGYAPVTALIPPR